MAEPILKQTRTSARGQSFRPSMRMIPDSGRSRRAPLNRGFTSTVDNNGNQIRKYDKISLLSDHELVFKSALKNLGVPDSELGELSRIFFEEVQARRRNGWKPSKLPEPGSGYPMFPGRRAADAVDWYREHWLRFVQAGLDQASLRRLDEKLMKALENEFEGRKAELAALLPSKRDRRSKEVEAAGLDPANREHRRRVSIASTIGLSLKK